MKTTKKYRCEMCINCSYDKHRYYCDIDDEHKPVHRTDVCENFEGENTEIDAGGES